MAHNTHCSSSVHCFSPLLVFLRQSFSLVNDPNGNVTLPVPNAALWPAGPCLPGHHACPLHSVLKFTFADIWSNTFPCGSLPREKFWPKKTRRGEKKWTELEQWILCGTEMMRYISQNNFIFIGCQQSILNLQIWNFHFRKINRYKDLLTNQLGWWGRCSNFRKRPGNFQFFLCQTKSDLKFDRVS